MRRTIPAAPILTLLTLLALPAAVAADDRGDTGAQPGYTFTFGGGKKLNQVGADYSYTFALADDIELQLTTTQNISDRPEAESERIERTLRADLIYALGDKQKITTYYEQGESYSDNSKSQQRFKSFTHRIGATTNYTFSDKLKADFSAYLNISNVEEESYQYFFDFIDREYDMLAAYGTLNVSYHLSEAGRLDLSAQLSRDARTYPNQPLLDSEYYYGVFTSSLNGAYTLSPRTSFNLRYTFSGQLHRDRKLIERDMDLYSNSLAADTAIDLPADLELTLNGEYSDSQTFYLNEEVWLDKYYYLIYPELHPIPEYRTKTPMSPLYNTRTESLNWKVGLNFDPTDDSKLHWSFTRNDETRNYTDDNGLAPPPRFSVADSIYEYYKNAMLTDSQLDLGLGFVMTLRHSIVLDSYVYTIAENRDVHRLSQTIRSGVKWKLTRFTELFTNIDLGFDRTVRESSSTLPRGSNLELEFGGESRVADGVRVKYTVAFERYNQRSEDFSSGSDSLKRKFSIEPTFSISDYWNLRFSGDFSEQISFPVGGETGTTWLRYSNDISAIVNLTPSPRLSFEFYYNWDYSSSQYTDTSYSSEHSIGMEISYNVFGDLIVAFDANYLLDEYDPDDTSFNIGLNLRSRLF